MSGRLKWWEHDESRVRVFEDAYSGACVEFVVELYDGVIGIHARELQRDHDEFGEYHDPEYTVGKVGTEVDAVQARRLAGLLIAAAEHTERVRGL